MTSTTSERIVSAAEQLFANEGIDRVTLRQIGRAAGQRNVAAVQYHFGNKEALLQTILDRHLDEIDERRRRLLEGLEVVPPQAANALMRVLVEPLADKLDDSSGRSYLRIQAQRIPASEMRPATRMMTDRIRDAIGRRQADALLNRFATLLLFHALADRAEMEQDGRAAAPDRPAFVAGLMRALGNLLSENSQPALREMRGAPPKRRESAALAKP